MENERTYFVFVAECQKQGVFRKIVLSHPLAKDVEYNKVVKDYPCFVHQMEPNEYSLKNVCSSISVIVETTSSDDKEAIQSAIPKAQECFNIYKEKLQSPKQ